jgi:hypothetical protein
VPSTIAQTIGGPANSGFPAGTQLPAPTPSGSMVPGQSDRLSILQQELHEVQAQPDSSHKAGDIDAINRSLQRLSGSPENQPTALAQLPRSVGAPFGAETGAKNAQDELSKSYQAQKDAHQNAQTTNSYLDNILDLSKKAAVGPQSDKLQYANGLLSMVGSQKATDAVTANNLLDKYSNQIVARLGGGGMGTDAARSIIASAYPNSHMNAPAIQEAVSNIKGANDMTMARTQIVAPYGDKRDPSGFSQVARTFDQNADPRIFQFAKMAPDQRAQFKATLSPAQATDFSSRIRNLQKMGVNF